MDVVVVTGPPNPDMNWWKPISQYLQLEATPNDETETQQLVCQPKGYLIHSDELYHRSTSGILERCIPI
jgi:hypothetical protein